MGGGIRKMFGGNALVGGNGFYDSTILGWKRYDSAGVGREFAAQLEGGDAIDLGLDCTASFSTARRSKRVPFNKLDPVTHLTGYDLEKHAIHSLKLSVNGRETHAIVKERQATERDNSRYIWGKGF